MPATYCRHCNPVIKRYSKRWRATLVFLFLNFCTFWASMYEGIDLTTVGVGLAALNAPLYGYLWSEAYRPSQELKEINNIENEKGKV